VLLVECVGRAGDNAYEMQAGFYHLFGDAALIGRIRDGLEHPRTP
jgi:hypothetical protein